MRSWKDGTALRIQRHAAQLCHLRGFGVIGPRVVALDILDQKAILIDERAALNKRIDTLEREIRHLVDFDEQSQKYERVQTPRGKFVYRKRKLAGGNAGAPQFLFKVLCGKEGFRPARTQGRYFSYLWGLSRE
jgi:hypothetical protein